MYEFREGVRDGVREGVRDGVSECIDMPVVSNGYSDI